MPKELNISANQRIDLDDFEYGTRTFTVDSLRAHVSRLLSGPYHGGFVLEGFRVAFPDIGAANPKVEVTNGVAIDRTGRLITYEEGNQFLNNPLSSGAGEVPLLETASKNYIMIEFTLIDGDDEEKGFWDPTFPNPAIKDSSGDDVPQPKGKEVPWEVPTRKAQSWKFICTGTGFEDTVDPNKIRVPIAIIPMDTATGLIDLTQGSTADPATGDTEQSNTTILEQPQITASANLAQVYCTNTRTLPNSGRIKVFKQHTGAAYTFDPGATEVISYTINDRQNNILTIGAGITAVGDLPSQVPQIGDIIRFEDTGIPGADGTWYLKDGSQYDCRPMFFSFTDDKAALAEDINPFGPVGTESGDRLQDSRGNRHWSGVSLMVDPSTSGDITANYPAVQPHQQKAVTIPARRVENRMKQSQDFFRVLSILMQEMKYGVAYDVVGTTTEASSASPAAGSVLYQLGYQFPVANKYVVDTGKVFSQELVGSWVRFTTGANYAATPMGRRQVSKVIGEHVLELSSAFGATIAASDNYVVEVNYPSNIQGNLALEYVGGFVDTRYTGSLQEVWNARVDQFTGSYAEDLNRRLSANKVATITVGDGISTHGDFVGGAGLLAAFTEAFKRPSTIYIREGTYNVANNLPIDVGPDTTVIGAGKDKTIIKLLGSGTSAASTPNYFSLRGRGVANVTPFGTLSELTCSNVTFKDLTIESADEMANGDGTGAPTWTPGVGMGYPLITNGLLDFFTSPGVVGAGNPSSGIWLPNWNTATTTCSPVDNFTLENVRLLGGGRGDYTTGDDVTYSVYLVSDEVNFASGANTAVNKNVTFKNCTFDTHQGGTSILKSCQNVLVDGCTFRNADPTDAGGTDSLAPLEGITFASRVQFGALGGLTPLYTSGDFISDGDVLVTNCEFLGKLYTEAYSVNYPSNGAGWGRGWINFTPTYLGQNVEVSSCQFRGDLLGDNTAYTSAARTYKQGSSKTGTGIVNCSPFNISVVGCNFHTLNRGITTQIGQVSVRSSEFWRCSMGVSFRPELAWAQVNYTTFSGSGASVLGGTDLANFWNAGAPGTPAYYSQTSISSKPVHTYTKLLVNNCSFWHGTNGVQVGFYPYTPTGMFDFTHDLESTVDVSNCKFTSITYAGVSFNIDKSSVLFGAGSPFDVYSGGTNIYYNWSKVSIAGCKFSDCAYSSQFNGEMKDFVPDNLSTYQGIRLPVRSFEYVNNEHEHCSYDGRSFAAAGISSTNGGSHAFVLGEDVIFKGNTFVNVFNENASPNTLPAESYEVSPNALVLVQGILTATDNSWSINNLAAGKVWTALQVGLAGSPRDTASSPETQGPTLNISSNTVTAHTGSNHSITTGVCNGVYVGQVFPEGNTANTALNMTGVTPATTPANCGIITDGPHVRPTLNFTNNDFSLQNANFGLASIQHSNGAYTGTATAGNFGTAGYSNFWEWYSADVSNNNITINCEVSTLQDTLFYGNDIGCNLTTVDNLEFNAVKAAAPSVTSRYSFLGAANSAQPATYIACVDLRRCYRSFTSGTNVNDQEAGNSINVIGNVFRVEGSAVTITAASAASKNLQEVMGLRVSKFPMELNVKSNTFFRAPLYIKWSWNNPYHLTSVPRMDTAGACTMAGATMNIKDNTFFNDRTATTVDVNPATGFGHEGLATSTLTGSRYLNLNFTNNEVTAANDSFSGATDFNTWSGCVRFWHPDTESWSQAGLGPPAAGDYLWQLLGGFHVQGDYLTYKWNVKDNSLTNIFFRITQFPDGAGGVGHVAGATAINGELAMTSGTVVENNSLSVWSNNHFLLDEGTITGSLTTEFSIFGLSDGSSGANYGHTAYPNALNAGGTSGFADIESSTPGPGTPFAWWVKCILNWGILTSGTGSGRRIMTANGSILRP